LLGSWSVGADQGQASKKLRRAPWVDIERSLPCWRSGFENGHGDRAPSWSLGENQVIQPKKTGEMNMPKEVGMPREMRMSNGHGGHLYMQTNEIKNCIVHYHWSASGTLTEVERCHTGGAGSGTFKPISGQDSAPNAFEGAGSVILTPDRRFLFTTNGGDNSVSTSV
jgi:6-phosphogluconolactonase (cycloisomerase 2 family)